MEKAVARVVFLALLSVTLSLIPGCDGNVYVVNVNGTWLMKIEFNYCDMPGMFKGGASRMETIPVVQNGEHLDSSFQDAGGNDVTMQGMLRGGRFEGTWETRTPGNRLVRFLSFGHVFDTGVGLVLDGWMVVDFDSDFDCYNEQFQFWGEINPTSSPGGPGPVANLAYAGHGYSQDVDVIDTTTMTVIGTITGAGGYRMALSRDGRKLFGTGGDDLFTVSDTGTNTMTTSFDPGVGFPEIFTSEFEPICLSPDGSRVYILDEQGSTALFVIDAATNAVLSGTPLPMDEPENVVISPDGRFLYCVDNSDVVKIDTVSLQIVGTVPTGSDAHGVAINPAGTRVYAEGVTGGIDVYDTATMTTVGNIPGGTGYYLEMSRDGRRLYGVNESTTLSVMDTTTNTLIQNVTLTGTAAGVTTNQDGSVIFVATSQGLARIDAATLTETGRAVGTRGYRSVIFR